MTNEFDPDSEENRPGWSPGCLAVVAVAVVGGVIVGVVGVVALTSLVCAKAPTASSATAAEVAVSASSGRLTLEMDDGASLKTVDRAGTPELWFRVVLENAPLGKELTLTCEWIDSTGKVAHRNQYRTKEIARTPWPTHARHRLARDAPPGTWTVRLLLSGQELRKLTFEVREGEP